MPLSSSPALFPIRQLASGGMEGAERADRLSRLAHRSTPSLAYILQNIAEAEPCVALGRN